VHTWTFFGGDGDDMELVKLGGALITPDNPIEPDEGFGGSRTGAGAFTDTPDPSEDDK